MLTSSEDQQAERVLRQFCYAQTPEQFAPQGTLGGLSGARFWSVTIDSRSFLLRRWPPHTTAEWLRGLHDLLRYAARCGLVGIACPSETSRGESVVTSGEHRWELTPLLPGEPFGAGSNLAERVATGAATLARLHLATADFTTRPASEGTPPSALKRASALHALARDAPRTKLDRVDPRAISQTDASELLERLVQQLPRACEQADMAATSSTRLQMIHGDARREHLLFSGSRVTGIVDFGASTHDTPMVDLARWLNETAADAPTAWRGGVDAYAAVRHLSNAERRLIPLLTSTGVVTAGFNWLRWATDTSGFEDPEAARRRIGQIQDWAQLLGAGRHAAQLCSV